MTNSLMVRDVDTQLKNIYDTFKRVNSGNINGIGPWSMLYKETFLWDKFRVFESHWMSYVYDRSVTFPEIHSILQIIRPTLEQALDISAPPLIQEKMYELSRLALEIRLYGKTEDRDKYVRMAAPLKCFPPTLRYYIEAVEAHAKFADYLLYGSPSPRTLERILILVIGISNCPKGGVKYLENFQSLCLDYTQPDNKEALEIIRRDEGQHVEFKACYQSSNTKRQYDKKNLSQQRITSVVAFLNSNDGNLFIGVDDDMTIHGIEDELMQYHSDSEDKFVMQLTSLFRDSIYTRTTDNLELKALAKPKELITISLVSINGHTVAWVQVKQSREHLFFYRESKSNYQFFIRTGRNKEKIKPEDIERYLALQDGISV
ncbi:ATP-binding protein [Shewanella frigidimarina]|uniref:AlbA family DNA-binding domain-containing protein n=1 Tax=Shewanella frigidimarina TaxID=56812 RepID=UPI0031814EA2